MRVVVDTNAFINSMGRKSINRPFFDAWRSGAFTLCVSTEIMLEYEEMLPKFFSEHICSIFMEMLWWAPNVENIEPYFVFDLCDDPDDNKFVDVFLAAKADVLISDDNALLSLAKSAYPPLNVMKLSDAIDLLKLS